MLGVDVIPTLDFDRLDEFLLEFEEHDMEISSGVMVVGDAAAYAEVWEWGNTRQKQQGPRTVLGPNPRGEIVWLSTQAPEGWIRVHEDQFWAVFEKELGKAQFAQPSASAMTQELEKRADAASDEIAKLLKEFAPKDTLQLTDAIQAVKAGSAILDIEQDDSGALEMVGGGE